MCLFNLFLICEKIYISTRTINIFRYTHRSCINNNSRRAERKYHEDQYIKHYISARVFFFLVNARAHKLRILSAGLCAVYGE